MESVGWPKAIVYCFVIVSSKKKKENVLEDVAVSGKLQISRKLEKSPRIGK